MNPYSIIIGNGLTLVGMVMLLLSSAQKNKTRMLAFQSVNYATYIVAGVLLKGYSGAMQSAVDLLRNVFLLTGRLSNVGKIIFVIVGLGLSTACNNRGIIGVLPIASSCAYSIAVVHPRSTERTLKAVLLFNTIAWAIYSFVIQNYVGVVFNLITAVSTMIFLVRDIRRQYREK